MRRLGLTAMCIGLVCGAIGTGAAEAQLDRGFGQGGVVRIEPSNPPIAPDHSLWDFGAGRDGSSYMLFGALHCDGGTCSGSREVVRYGPGGTADAGFGSNGSYELPPGGMGVSDITVDSSGRVLITELSTSSVVVRRLNPDGFLDGSFGSEGVVSVACGCEPTAADLMLGHDGRLTVRVLGGEEPARLRPSSGVLIRLNEDGSLVEDFGRGGIVTFDPCGMGRRSARAIGSRGAIYLSGATCTRSERPYLIRISRSGRVDSRFMRTTFRALRPLAGVGAVVVRRSGDIDVIGGDGSPGSLLMRLKRDGQVQQNFGTNGHRKLPLRVVSTARGSDGAIVAMSGEEEGVPMTIFRILPTGHIDRRFGLEEIPSSTGDFGVSMAALSGRRVLVLDYGVHVDCRGECKGHPRLIRYLEGSPRRGR